MAKTQQIERKDIAQIVTDKIVQILEQGSKPWTQPWVNGRTLQPLRHTGEPYRGINVLLLWAAADEAGYTAPYWMTYQQTLQLGAQVRKGERGSMVVYYGQAQKREAEVANEGEEGRYRFLKSFTVFNVQQIDGLPEKYNVSAAPRQACTNERVTELDALLQATGADIRTGGNRAFYRIDTDHVQMPPFESFPDAEKYYAVSFHELVHWTRHPKRLDRDFGRKVFGDEGYAKEELVAELGSAFLGAELGLQPYHIEDHASYIASWIKALKDDKRFLLKAAAKAQQAVDYLLAKREVASIEEAA